MTTGYKLYCESCGEDSYVELNKHPKYCPPLRVSISCMTCMPSLMIWVSLAFCSAEKFRLSIDFSFAGQLYNKYVWVVKRILLTFNPRVANPGLGQQPPTHNPSGPKVEISMNDILLLVLVILSAGDRHDWLSVFQSI